MTTLEDLLADIKLDGSLYDSVIHDQFEEKSFQKLMAENPNLVVLAKSLWWAISLDPERDERPREHRAFINLIGLLLNAFAGSPYWSSRIGWLMWFWACYARNDSYYPMKWCFHYDPANWYRHDEPWRPPGMERLSPEDPYNIKGECFVHPEWYRKNDKPGGSGD